MISPNYFQISKKCRRLDVYRENNKTTEMICKPLMNLGISCTALVASVRVRNYMEIKSFSHL